MQKNNDGEFMVILGLGSNLGDRLHNLRLAYQQLLTIPELSIQKISPIYISDALLPEHATPDWDIPYLNLALRCETTLSPHALLERIKKIEIEVGRKKESHWGPRIIDIDLLAWDDLIIYDERLHIPHENLHERPFALWPLADVAPDWIYPLNNQFKNQHAEEMVAKWGSRFDGNAPFHTRQISQRIDTPQLVGILNITTDSFSDGGKFFDTEAAINQAIHLVETGAQIIDIGAQSTAPNATMINAETEWQRLEPVLKQLLSFNKSFLIKPKISIDTFHVSVAEKSLAMGVDWINDVSGLQNKEMRTLIANNNCNVIFMHNLGLPTSKAVHLPVNTNPIATLIDWAHARINEAEKFAIAPDKLIFDVGIGFGKTAFQDLHLLQHIQEFKQLGVKLLVGHSRKYFYSRLTHKVSADRDIETTITSLHLAKQNVDYLRVHNCEMHSDAFKIFSKFP